MPDVPTPGQLALLFASVAMFLSAAGFAFFRLRSNSTPNDAPARHFLYWGIFFGAGVLIWHSIRRQSWLPLEDNFDALIWLGLLLALFIAYIQLTHPLRGLDCFVLPIIILMLVSAAVFGRAKPHEYIGSTWAWMHRVTAYGGAIAFAVGGAGGAMYLVAHRRLRRKQAANLGSLERLEHFTRTSVTLGFSLLTVGLITGLVRALDPHHQTLLGANWYQSPKVWLAFAAWMVYVVALHAPINPSFRGRRAAMLSVVGFVLMVGTLVAVQYMPGTRN